jgi:hypothetical protein
VGKDVAGNTAQCSTMVTVPHDQATDAPFRLNVRWNAQDPQMRGRSRRRRLPLLIDHDVAVGVEREALPRVPELRGDLRHRHALGDLDRGVTVSQVVGVPVDDAGGLAGARHDVLGPALTVRVRAGVQEAESHLARTICEQRGLGRLSATPGG